MISPTGKIPNVRPGIKNPCSAEVFAPALDPELAEANAPLTKDVPLLERSVMRDVPLALVPENAMVGASNERMASLRGG